MPITHDDGNGDDKNDDDSSLAMMRKSIKERCVNSNQHLAIKVMTAIMMMTIKVMITMTTTIMMRKRRKKEGVSTPIDILQFPLGIRMGMTMMMMIDDGEYLSCMTLRCDLPTELSGCLMMTIESFFMVMMKMKCHDDDE